MPSQGGGLWPPPVGNDGWPHPNRPLPSEICFDEPRGFAHELDLASIEMREPAGERGDPAFTRPVEDALALGGRGDADDSAVVAVRGAFDEPVPLQAVDDRAHRRGSNLLGGGELADGLRAAEDEHRNGGGAGRGGAPPPVLRGG